MPAKKITIELLPVRVKIARGIKQATRNINQGKKAILKATREGRTEDAKKNRKRIKKAENALAKLKKANQLMNDACCHQRFNCDPSYF